MLIQGTFKNINEDTIKVKIYNPSNSHASFTIGNDSSADVYFAGDEPVTVQAEECDTLNQVMRYSAKINLVTRIYLGDALWSANPTSTVVNIYKNNSIVFAGYLQHNTYSQEYAYSWSEITLNCIDVLSSLEYRYLSDASNYDTVKANRGIKSFYDIIHAFDIENDDINLSMVQDTPNINNPVLPDYDSKIWFDNSKKLSTDGNLFNEVGINDAIFLGDIDSDEENDMEILKSLLQYLNLHIVQIGYDFYIYDIETCRTDNTVVWYNLSDITDTLTKNVTAYSVTTDYYSSDDTNIETADVYSRVEIHEKPDALDAVVSNILDDDELTSPYSNKQLYCREYCSEGEGRNAWQAFKDMVTNGTSTYADKWTREWYMQVKQPKNWTFKKGSDDIYSSYVVTSNNTLLPQTTLPANMQGSGFVSGIIAMGAAEKSDPSNDEPSSNISMTNSLYISINGNGSAGENSCHPNDSDFENANLEIKYTAPVSANFTPVDSGTINYIVISGKIRLNPLAQKTGVYPLMSVDNHGNATLQPAVTVTNTFQRAKDWVNNWRYDDTFLDNNTGVSGVSDFYQSKYNTCPISSNKKGGYYQQRFYAATLPSDTPLSQDQTVMLSPPLDFGSKDDYDSGWLQFGKMYHYVLTGTNNPMMGTDTISKVPILMCKLKVGDKYFCEWTENGVEKREWRAENNLPRMFYDSTYHTIDYFTIGFNPKGDDWIIGEQHNIANTITNQMNLGSLSGTAIPITYADAVNGNLEFSICGVCNAWWNDQVRVHPTWFRHTKWNENCVPIMPFVSSIILDNFEVHVASNNGGVSLDNTTENEIVYMSDEQTDYIKPLKSDFDIMSALTTEDARNLGVVNSVNKNTATNMTTGNALLTITDNHSNETAKPEHLYVDSVFNEYNSPKLEVSTSFFADYNISLFDRATFPYFSGKTFFVKGISRDLKNDTNTIIFKEI